MPKTESIFHTYSQYASSSKLPPAPSEEEQRLETQINDLLERVCQPSTNSNHIRADSAQRESLINQLARLLDSTPDLTTSTLKQNNLSRHREVLVDHTSELRRLRSAISASRNRANLLSNVRSDIDAYRSSNPADEEAEYMLQERGRIENSHNMIDGVLSQAYAINENFGIQAETLARVNRRIVGAASQIPGINGLIGRIGAKKRRDGIILGSFIAFCFLVLFFFR